MFSAVEGDVLSDLSSPGRKQHNELTVNRRAGPLQRSHAQTDNRGARGLWGKPEARLWYFKRPEWLWSQLSINRCTQTRKTATITDEREVDVENIDRLLQVCKGEPSSPSSKFAVKAPIPCNVLEEMIVPDPAFSSCGRYLGCECCRVFVVKPSR